jgi:hypothetical protein
MQIRVLRSLFIRLLLHFVDKGVVVARRGRPY